MFQSLKGFGGLWNQWSFFVADFGATFQSLKGFGGLWNQWSFFVADFGATFQSLKGFGGLWNSQEITRCRSNLNPSFNP